MLPTRWPEGCFSLPAFCWCHPPTVTSTLPPPFSFPWPLIHSTLFFLNRRFDAFGMLVDDLVLAIADQFHVQLRIANVNTLCFGVGEAVPNFGRMEQSFGGIHPTRRQVPPSLVSFSTTAVLNPYCPARIAAE